MAVFKLFGTTRITGEDVLRMDLLEKDASAYVEFIQREARLEKRRREEEERQRIIREREEQERLRKEREREAREREERERRLREQREKDTEAEDKEEEWGWDPDVRYSLACDTFRTEDLFEEREPEEEIFGQDPFAAPPKARSSIRTYTNMTFTEKLYDLMQKRHMKSPQVYRAAGLDKSLFSRILSDRNYRVKKDTAIAIAFGLELTLEEAKNLLERAGYTLSHSIPRDILLEYCFKKRLDVIEADILLDRLGFEPLSNSK